MTSFAERIIIILKNYNLKKIEFANTIKVNPSYISKILKENIIPSGRVIDSICRIYNINEEWLRTGEGPMLLDLSKEDEIALWFGKILNPNNNDQYSYMKDFIYVLSKLSVKEWEVLVKITQMFIEEQKKQV